MNIKTIELTALGTSKFNKWVADVGKANLILQAVAMEALARFEGDISSDQSPTYELGQQFTITGKAEVFKLSDQDYTIELCEDN